MHNRICAERSITAAPAPANLFPFRRLAVGTMCLIVAAPAVPELLNRSCDVVEHFADHPGFGPGYVIEVDGKRWHAGHECLVPIAVPSVVRAAQMRRVA